MQFLPWFMRDLEDALTIIGTRAPERAHEIRQFRKALANNSAILPKRFEVLLGNALGGHEKYAFTEAEKQDLAQTLVRLEEYCRDGRPGPKVRGNEYRLMVYLTKEENESLIEYCEKKNVTRAAAVRAGLHRLLQSPS